MYCPLGPVLLGALLVGSCGVSPQPAPPPDEVPGIALDFLVVQENGMGVSLRGSAGAVTDGVTVTGLNVSRLAFAASDVAADGSFDMSFPGFNPDQYRLQVFGNAARSTPIDLVGSDGAGLLSPAPRLACAALDFDSELDFGEVAAGDPRQLTITITNNCPDVLDIASAEPALVDASFTLFAEPDVPLTLATDTTALIRVTLDPTSTGRLIDYLVIDWTSGGQNELRVVTLIGTGT